MQPRPMAETSRRFLPSMRACIFILPCAWVIGCCRSGGGVSLCAGPVLRVADMLHPIHDLTVQRFLKRNVGHGRGRRGTVPVLLVRREQDDVAWPDFLDWAAVALHPAAAGGDNQRLTQRMGVPRR